MAILWTMNLFNLVFVKNGFVTFRKKIWVNAHDAEVNQSKMVYKAINSQFLKFFECQDPVIYFVKSTQEIFESNFSQP